jgi:Xaa-Pro aminopeptidase
VYLPNEGFGIRIEDDLLITKDGCDELTKAIPKSIPDIEAAMR